MRKEMKNEERTMERYESEHLINYSTPSYLPTADGIMRMSDNINITHRQCAKNPYVYEKPIDKKQTMKSIISTIQKLELSLAEITDEHKKARTQKVIKNMRDILVRNQEYIEKNMGLCLAQLVPQHTL